MSNTKELPLCSVEHLSVKKGERNILNIPTLKIKKGEPFAIIGKSGAGKTTLLNSLTGLIDDYSGNVLYNGINLKTLTYLKRSEHFGFVFQDFQLFPHLTVLQNLSLIFQVKRIPIDYDFIRNITNELKIDDLIDRYPHEISGGQKQRVAIARNLLQSPSILFLDEPSASLDKKTSMELAETLEKLNHKTQVIVVSHDEPFLKNFVQKAVKLENGEIANLGNLSEII